MILNKSNSNVDLKYDENKINRECLIIPNQLIPVPSKALYENMLVELPLSSFFLCKLLSRHGADVDIHHLESLDPEMYRYSLQKMEQ